MTPGQPFADIRQKLGLSSTQVSPNLVALYILVEGAQIELRRMTRSMLMHLSCITIGVKDKPTPVETQYPDLFQEYSFREQDIPPLVDEWIYTTFKTHQVSPARVKHSLSNLGREADVDSIIAMVEALFAMLNSKDLLDAFKATIKLILPGQQGNQAMNSTNQASAVMDPAQSQDFRPFMLWFWSEFVSGGTAKQLSYFLSNLLAFDVIPRIIGQALEARQERKALVLAHNISQSKVFTEAIEVFSPIAPNYLEFIVMYATERRLEGFPVFLADNVQAFMGPDFQRIFNCFAYPEPEFPWITLEATFGLKRPSNVKSWQEEFLTQCTPLMVKYKRSLFIKQGPVVFVETISEEETSDLFA
ncbi:hypothetical protein H4R35_000054 [Dimargaris xerosporica]|nr:hypothetical protein H4R35_000054 [Dimargaris xerosporica]